MCDHAALPYAKHQRAASRAESVLSSTSTAPLLVAQRRGRAPNTHYALGAQLSTPEPPPAPWYAAGREHLPSRRPQERNKREPSGASEAPGATGRSPLPPAALPCSCPRPSAPWGGRCPQTLPLLPRLKGPPGPPRRSRPRRGEEQEAAAAPRCRKRAASGAGRLRAPPSAPPRGACGRRGDGPAGPVRRDHFGFAAVRRRWWPVPWDGTGARVGIGNRPGRVRAADSREPESQHR